MKKFIFSIFIAVFAWAFATAQPTTGSVLIGTSTSLLGSSSYSVANGGNLSFFQSKTKVDGDKSDGPNSTIFNLSPRVGYTFMDGLVAGVKIDIVSLKEKEDDFEYKYNGLAGGPFARYYVGTAGNAKPFVEADAIFGRMTSQYQDNDKNKENTMHLGVGAGVGVFLGDHVSFDVMAGYSYNTSKDPDNEADVKSIVSGFSVGFGLSVFLAGQ